MASSPSTRAWPTEHEVADEIPLGLEPEAARRILADVPFWFHTFLLNRETEIYTPGEARDHGYRLDAIPSSFDGLSVLDVGAFDGFYSYLAEHRGAKRVLAVDNEQYLEWVKSRWDIDLEGAEAFKAMHGALDSKVEYRKMDALEAGGLDETFDFIFCFGILHRVEDPFGLIKALASRLRKGGRMLIETHGILGDAGAADGAILVPHPGDIYAKDFFVYWQFSSGALTNLTEFIEGFTFTTHSTPVIDGHPRILGTAAAPSG